MVVNYNVSPSCQVRTKSVSTSDRNSYKKNKEHSIQNAPYIFFIKTCQRHLIYNHLCRRRVFTCYISVRRVNEC